MTLPTTVSGIRFYLNIGLQIEFVLNRGGGQRLVLHILYEKKNADKRLRRVILITHYKSDQ